MIWTFMRPDSYQKLALYKSFVYLLSYICAYLLNSIADLRCTLTEAVHRLCDQRETCLSLHAEKSLLVQVSHLEAGHFNSVRVLHHVHDCAQHHHSHDEGRAIYLWLFSRFIYLYDLSVSLPMESWTFAQL